MKTHISIDVTLGLIVMFLSNLLLTIYWIPKPVVDTTPVKHIEKVVIYDGIARVTCYGPTGYRTSSQKVPAYGMVASSDRTIPLGTKVYIEDYGEMTVEDRTAKWVYEKHGFTFDIFLPEGCTKHFGTKYLRYEI